MLRHEGIWEGHYTHLAIDRTLVDRHATRIICEFPDSGPHAYVQHSRYIWADGRTWEGTLPAVLRDGRLWWDSERFHGSGWEAGDGLICLNLVRRDAPDSFYHELISLSPDGLSRQRTWQWFQYGRPWKRTLCDEVRVP
jgi:hypothetical protein